MGGGVVDITTSPNTMFSNRNANALITGNGTAALNVNQAAVPFWFNVNYNIYGKPSDATKQIQTVFEIDLSSQSNSNGCPEFLGFLNVYDGMVDNVDVMFTVNGAIDPSIFAADEGLMGVFINNGSYINRWFQPGSQVGSYKTYYNASNQHMVRESTMKIQICIAQNLGGDDFHIRQHLLDYIIDYSIR